MEGAPPDLWIPPSCCPVDLCRGFVFEGLVGALLIVVAEEAVEAGGINYFAGPTFEPKWSHFHHPENRCFTQADLDDDGVPELLVGRVDGCVLAYAAADGRLVAKIMLDGTVRCLAATADGVIAGTEQSLILLDRALRPVARRPGGVEAIAVVPRQGTSELIVAAQANGRVVGLTVSR
jgi:hypothetical protein